MMQHFHRSQRPVKEKKGRERSRDRRHNRDESGEKHRSRSRDKKRDRDESGDRYKLLFVTSNLC